MTLHRFSDLGEDQRGPRLDEARERLDLVLPGLRFIERDFDVPGRGKQEAVAAGPEGGCVLVEYASVAALGVLEGLLDRLAWFEENRPLITRLFAEPSLDPDCPVQAVILAPAFHRSLVSALARLSTRSTVHLLRLRLIRSEKTAGFMVEDPDHPDRPHPFATPRSAAPAKPPDHMPPETVPTFPPIRAVSPVELLSRSRHWLSRLSPDIKTETAGKCTRFLFSGDLLATMAIHEGHLEIDVPENPPVIRARDGHELNRGMTSVIKRYFSLVAPRSTARPGLKREDILTDGELAAFLNGIDPE